MKHKRQTSVLLTMLISMIVALFTTLFTASGYAQEDTNPPEGPIPPPQNKQLQPNIQIVEPQTSDGKTKPISPSPDGNVKIQGQTSGGQSQTTVIDANGNLKMVGPNKATTEGKKTETTPPPEIAPSSPLGQTPLTPGAAAIEQGVGPLQPQNPTLNPNQPGVSGGPMGSPNTNPNETIQPGVLPPFGTTPNQLQTVQPPNPTAPSAPTSPPPVGMPEQMPQGAAPQSQPQQMTTPQGTSGLAPPVPNQATIPINPSHY